MEKVSQQEFVRAIKTHYHWIMQDVDGWENMKADFSGKDLREVDMLMAAKEARIIDHRFDYDGWKPAEYVILDGADLRGADLRGIECRISLRDANLSKANMSHAHFIYVFDGNDLSGADLSGADFSHAELNALYLSHGMNCKGTNFSNAIITGRDGDIRFEGSVLHKTNFTNAKFKDGDFSRTEIRDCVFDGAYLGGADFKEAVISDTRFVQAVFEREDGADYLIYERNYGGADFREAILTKVSFDSANLNKTSLPRLDLTSVTLNHASLNKADLTGAKLSYGTRLEGADLGGAILRGLDLSGKNLSRADLRRADLNGANLEKARLWGSDLSGANLNMTNLAGADLRGTRLAGASMRFVNLEGAQMSMSEMKDASVHMADFSKAHMRESSLDLGQLSTSRYEDANFSGAVIETKGWNSWGRRDTLFEVTENCIRRANDHHETEKEIICAVLESDPHSVGLIDAVTRPEPGLIEKTPEIAAAYDNACDRLYDILEKQGLAYSDDKTHVLLLDCAGKTSIFSEEKYDLEAMDCLGMLKKDQMLITVRNSGRLYCLDEQRGRGTVNVQALSKTESIDAVKKTLEKIISERAGGLSRDLICALREMNAKLDSFAGKVKDRQAEKTKTEVRR